MRVSYSPGRRHLFTLPVYYGARPLDSRSDCGGQEGSKRMLRFRRKRRLQLNRRARAQALALGSGPGPWGWGNKKDFQERWNVIRERCTDRASLARLANLLNRLSSSDRGAKESALAELEIAVLLLRAGCSVTFLPESQACTADLECLLGQNRFVVEVTALVGGGRTSPKRATFRRSAEIKDGDGEDSEHVLVHRLLARISQKARQLSDYADPVVLSITVPHRDDHVDLLDLKRLAGAITVLLPLHNHLSGVILALWNVIPMPSRSGVRLRNVHVVERSGQQRAHPRVRLLVLNPAAARPLREEEFQVFRALL